MVDIEQEIKALEAQIPALAAAVKEAEARYFSAIGALQMARELAVKIQAVAKADEVAK